MASSIDIIVGATVDGALGGLRAVDSAINRLQPAAAAIGKVGKAAFAAVSAAVAAAGAALVSFVNQASEAEQVLAKFDSVFEGASTNQFTEQITTTTKEIEKFYNKLGQARYKVTYVTNITEAVRGMDEAFKDTIVSLADAASQITRFDDEAILSAATQLLAFGEIGQDVFERVLESSLDLAEFMGTDAAAAAETLGRALADVSNGSLSLLYRQKLLTKEQVATAEAMAETGDVAGAQAYVLDILDGKIGDLAETMGKTFSGQMTILKNNLGNIAEELGGKLLPVLAPVVAKFAELVEKYGPLVSDFFDKIIVPGLQKAVTGFLDFIDALTNGEFNLEEFLLGLDFGAMSESLIAAIDSVDWNAIGQEIGHWIGVAFEVAKNFVAETDWSGIFASLGQAIADLGTGLGGGDWEEFKTVWTANWNQLVQIVDNVVRIVKARFESLRLADFVPAMLGAVVTAMGAGVASIVLAVTALVNRIITAFRSKLSQFRAIGKAILDGIKAGIMSGWDAFASWLEGIVMSIIQAVLDALGISSPSKVFADIGKQMMAGMAQGIARNVSMPMATMQMATAGVIGATHNVNNSYYYGARLMLSQGQEGQILATLTE